HQNHIRRLSLDDVENVVRCVSTLIQSDRHGARLPEETMPVKIGHDQRLLHAFQTTWPSRAKDAFGRSYTPRLIHFGPQPDLGTDGRPDGPENGQVRLLRVPELHLDGAVSLADVLSRLLGSSLGRGVQHIACNMNPVP